MFSQWLIDDYAMPFVVLNATNTIAEAWEQVKTLDTKLNRIVLVINDESEWRVIFLSEIAPYFPSDQTAINSEIRLGSLPLVAPDEIITEESRETSEAIEARLSGRIILIENGETVVWVFAHRLRGGSVNEVSFTAYIPRQLDKDQRQNLLVYAHLDDAFHLVEEDTIRFAPELDDGIDHGRRANQSTMLRRGAWLTVIPESSTLEFNPPRQRMRWDYEWQRFGFELTSKQTASYHEVRVSIRLGLQEIASIALSMDESDVDRPSTSHLGSKGSLYQQIFISYSHKDTAVASQYRLAQLMRGDDVFMDTYSLRTGSDWEQALKVAILKADIFQLFWSPNAKQSEYVESEWRYFWEQRCKGDTNQCQGRLRPVYWQIPLDAFPPPPELQSLHFQFVEIDNN